MIPQGQTVTLLRGGKKIMLKRRNQENVMNQSLETGRKDRNQLIGKKFQSQGGEKSLNLKIKFGTGLNRGRALGQEISQGQEIGPGQTIDLRSQDLGHKIRTLIRNC